MWLEGAKSVSTTTLDHDRLGKRRLIIRESDPEEPTLLTDHKPSKMCEFVPVIEAIFNNWTALKLCLDHGMGGDPATVDGKLRNFVDAVQTALSENCDFYDLVDLLEDTFDTDFDTELQDGSATEVATVLTELYKGWNDGRKEEVLKQIRQMPQPVSILEARQRRPRPSSSTEASRKRPPPPPPVEVDDDEPMGEGNPGADSGAWTVVTRKK